MRKTYKHISSRTIMLVIVTITVLTAGILLTGCACAEKKLSIQDAEAAGFIKATHKFPACRFVDAQDGWTGTWVGESVLLYVYEDSKSAEEATIYFASEVGPDSEYGWVELCVIHNLLMLSDGDNACRELEKLQ